MKSLRENTRKLAGVAAGGVVGVILTFGVLAGSQVSDLWRKVDQTIRPVPDNIAVQIGDEGTGLNELIFGTCDLLGMDVSHAATTTKAYDCAVTGVETDDFVLAGQPTTTPQTNLGWALRGANASSTAGFITIHILNLTGGDAVPSDTAVGSSTPYLIMR